MLEKLLQTTEREDAEENNLRCSAYEATNVLIQNAAKDTHGTILTVVPIFIDRLAKTFQMQVRALIGSFLNFKVVSMDDREEQTELQSLLCGVLQVIIQKMVTGSNLTRTN